MTSDRSKQVVEAEHILDACRKAGVVVYYYPEINVVGMNGEAVKIACLVMDVLKLQEPIKQLMDEFEILDSLGTPRRDTKTVKQLVGDVNS